MKSCRPPLFWKRKFEPTVIVTCASWYLRFCLSLRDLEELMAERRLAVDHTSIWRWIQAYGAVKPKSSTWHMMRRLSASPANGCTCSARWMRMARRLISTSLRHGTVKQPNCSLNERWPTPTTALRKCSPEMDCGAIRPRSGNCRSRVTYPALPTADPSYCNNRIESDHRHLKRRLRSMQGP